jgi:hypothetical protein
LTTGAANQPAPFDLRDAVAPGLAAIRSVRVPFVLALLCGLAFVVSYYTVPGVAAACEGVTRLKARFGFAFSAVGGIVAGVIVPELFKLMTLRGHRVSAREMAYNSIYFAGMAVLVDALYRGLDAWLGSGLDLRTIVTKVAIDQLFFTPTLGVSIAAVFFPLRESGFDWRGTFAGFGTPRWYARRVVPLVIPAWCFWIPAVTLIYSLPPLLQMPFSLCATAAWSLLMVAITKRQAASVEMCGLAEAEAFNR